MRLQKALLQLSSSVFCVFRDIHLSLPKDSMITWPVSTLYKSKSLTKFSCVSQQPQHHLQTILCRYMSFPTKSNTKNMNNLIIVLGHDDSVIGIKTKEEAAKLAKKKNMRLMKLENQTTYKKYPVYQLSTGAHLIKDGENIQNKAQLEEKNLTFSYKISNNDLYVKINSIEKWLKKRNCQVKVLIVGETGKEQVLDELYNKIESHFGNTARLLQKVVKNGNMKFFILRPKET